MLVESFIPLSSDEDKTKETTIDIVDEFSGISTKSAAAVSANNENSMVTPHIERDNNHTQLPLSTTPTPQHYVDEKKNRNFFRHDFFHSTFEHILTGLTSEKFGNSGHTENEIPFDVQISATYVEDALHFRYVESRRIDARSIQIHGWMHGKWRLFVVFMSIFHTLQIIWDKPYKDDRYVVGV